MTPKQQKIADRELKDRIHKAKFELNQLLFAAYREGLRVQLDTYNVMITALEPHRHNFVSALIWRDAP